MKFSITDFFRKYDQIRRFLRVWSHLLKKSLTEIFSFCAVSDANHAVPVVINPTDATFKIADTKLYLPVVTLSIEDDNKL